MKTMENKEAKEIEFWKQFVSDKDFGKFRLLDDAWKINNFPGLRGKQSRGLDVGCGPLSVFEKTSNNVIAIDPLMDEYFEIYKGERKIKYLKASGENIPFEDDYFDYSYCCNVIDHTPNPEKMISEMKRVTKDKIYFQVNFDDNLSDCHYGLWNEDKVNEMFKIKPIFKEITDGENQKLFWSIYQL